MQKSRVLVLVFLVASCALVAVAPSERCLDDLLDKLVSKEKQIKLGWAGLLLGERQATAEFVQSLNRERLVAIQMLAQSHSDEDDAKCIDWKEPQEFLEDAGWTQLTCGTARVDGKEYLVVQNRFSNWATSDVPIGLSLLGDRKCWCKSNRFSGGVSEIIYKGRLHQLRFADWKELR